jgi:hypothetical protein
MAGKWRLGYICVTDNPGVRTATEGSGWQANYEPVPEPSNLALVLCGLTATTLLWCPRHPSRNPWARHTQEPVPDIPRVCYNAVNLYSPDIHQTCEVRNMLAWQKLPKTIQRHWLSIYSQSSS